MLLAPSIRRCLLALGLELVALATASGALAAGSAIPGTFEGTGQKPQSKLWYNDGTWWAIIKKEGHGLHFYEFDGTQWTPSLFMDAELGAGGEADVKWNGQELFVLAYSTNPSLFKYTYDKNLRVFNLVAGFPVPLHIASGSETMVLDQDSNGRLWATYEGGNGDVYVCWSTSPDHREWSMPGLIIRSGIKVDDISTLVAFDGKIGVFWSDQLRWQFGFRVHRDTDPPEIWQPAEVVLSGSGCSDDHLNLKADSQGNLYCVSKDLYNHMRLHYRSVSTGKWTNKTGVIPSTGTRGIVMVSDQDKAIYVAYTNWGSSALDVNLRKASYGSMSFSNATTPLINGTTLNNCTGTKQVLPRGCLMVLAEGAGRTWWNGWGELPLDGPQPPPAPTNVHLDLTVPPAQQNGAAPLACDLPFDEAAGSTSLDRVSGTASARLLVAAGKPSPPQWTAGHHGAALRFDGLGGYVETASSTALRIAGSFGVEAWVRWDGSASAGTILGKGKSGKRNYQVQVQSNGKIDFRWEVSGGTRHGLVGNAALVPGTWKHVACVYDAAAGTSRIFLDGRLDATVSDSGIPITSSDALEIGARLGSSGPTEFFAGCIDEVRIASGAPYSGDFDPEAPHASAASFVSHNLVQVSWTAPTFDAPMTYRVYRRVNGAAPIRLATGLTAASFLDEVPLAGVLCYQVTAVDSALREGKPSVAACIGYAPEAPPMPDLSKTTPQAPGWSLRAAPNPFNPQTRLRLEMPQAGWARLAVYDAAGRRVALLHSGPLGAGPHQFDWMAGGAHGHLHSGIYFARLDALGRTLHQKLVLLQ